ncbi:MAG: DNA polymerase III subunit delta [bacterium]|nr:DNA polymerase III subunit delta [bacterium]
MIIFFHGPDSFRINKKIQEITEKYQSKYRTGLNLKIIDENNIEETDIRTIFSLKSMFKEKKLVILKNLLNNQEIQQIILDKAKIIIPSDGDIVFLIIENELKEKNKQINDFLKKNSKNQEFKLLTGSELKTLILKTFKNNGFDFEPNVPEKIIDYIGNDLWRMDSEIKKLMLFKQEEKKINLEDIEILIRPNLETNIFQTIDQLAKGDKKQFLNMIHNHLNQGDEPLYLLSMIIFQLRNLLIIKELLKYPNQKDLVLKSLKINPFIVRKITSFGQSLDKNKLKDLYQRVFQLDSKIKTGEIEPVLGLDLFAVEI